MMTASTTIRLLFVTVVFGFIGAVVDGLEFDKNGAGNRKSLPAKPRRGLLGRPPGGFRLVPDDIDELNTRAEAEFPTIETLFLTQPIDHFNQSDTRAYKQRFMVNQQFYQSNGPIFIMIGGESEIRSFWMTGGYWVEIGKKYNAMFFQLEHRYYGVSQPFSDLSTPNLKYLSSHQALADLDAFIHYAQKTFISGSNRAKVILFGGSYSGSLAAWSRRLYPKSSDGSVASSAPIYSTPDNSGYLEIVARSAEYNFPGCRSLIKEAFTAVTNLLAAGNFSAINNIFQLVANEWNRFRLCKPLNMSDRFDIDDFYNSIVNTLELDAQYNNQGLYTMQGNCMVLADKTYGANPMERLAYELTAGGLICHGYDYHKVISELRDTQLGTKQSASGDRQWVWQTCTELGDYQTTDSPQQPFGHGIPLEYFETIFCQRVFGVNALRTQRGSASTDELYGGYHPGSTWVTYVNGEIDPWSALGMNKSTDLTNPVILIQGASHCQDMGPSDPHDSAAMKAAKAKIAQSVFYQLLSN